MADGVPHVTLDQGPALVGVLLAHGPAETDSAEELDGVAVVFEDVEAGELVYGELIC